MSDKPNSVQVLEESGAGLIAIERQRQVAEEGYDADHDDEHDDGIIAVVAAGLAVSHHPEAKLFLDDGQGEMRVFPGWDEWGLQQKFGRFVTEGDPKDRVRVLVVAGALIAAEIDRLMRQQTREHPET